MNSNLNLLKKIVSNWGVFFILTITLTPSFSWAGQRENFCYDSMISRSKVSVSSNVSARYVEWFLDCLAGGNNLSQLSAQWIVLRKAHWRMTQGQTTGNYWFADNPYDPKTSHHLHINSSNLNLKNGANALKKKFYNLMTQLESSIFPKALKGFSQSALNNKTAWSFESTVNHFVAVHDTPAPWWKKMENAKINYPGTLQASANFPSGWFDNLKNRALGKGVWVNKTYTRGVTGRKNDFSRYHQKAFEVLDLSLYGSSFWPKLRNLYNSLTHVKKTKCLYRQHRTVVQALFTTLEHPKLVEAIHFKKDPLKRFSPLTQSIGIGSDGFTMDPTRTSVTGDLEFAFSFSGYRPNWRAWMPVSIRATTPPPAKYFESYDILDYGPHAIIGRSLYIEGVNKSGLKSGSTVSGRNPVDFQGQNAIIRDISQSALTNLKNDLKSLGNPMDYMIRRWNGFSLSRGTFSSLEETVASLTGASLVAADYGLERTRGRTSLPNHPAMTEPFFTETIVSKGVPISGWLEILSDLQGKMAYHIVVWDYWLRQRPKSHGATSYYDRILAILNGQSTYFGKFQF